MHGEPYGEQDKCADHKDMWGQIQEEVAKGWFVPSKAEWSAFAEELGITSSNCTSKGLSYYYWSSSQGSEEPAWVAGLGNDCMLYFSVKDSTSVRLSATF